MVVDNSGVESPDGSVRREGCQCQAPDGCRLSNMITTPQDHQQNSEQTEIPTGHPLPDSSKNRYEIRVKRSNSQLQHPPHILDPLDTGQSEIILSGGTDPGHSQALVDLLLEHVRFGDRDKVGHLPRGSPRGGWCCW